MDIKIKKLESSDTTAFKELIRVFEDVFEMESFRMPADHYLKRLLENNTFFVFTASVEGSVVGGLTAYLMPQYYTESRLAYIYDMAVMTRFQRQGIGKMLIAGITEYCREAGIPEVFVQADDTDDHALEFYHASGAEKGKAVNFYYHLNTADKNV